MSDSNRPGITLLDRRLMCQNSRFDVYFDHIIDAGRHEVRDYLSVIPKNADAAGHTGSAVLPVRGDEIGLLRMFRHPQDRVSWEIPRGFMDPGERVVDAALRELKEETGYGPADPKVDDLGFVSPAPGVVRSKVRLFAVRVTATPQARRVDEIGHAGLEFFDWAQALSMADKGEIEEPCTLVAMYRYLVANSKGVTPTP